jgi:hypothetical protein
MKTVHAYTRRSNSGAWEFYGSFTEAEWRAELAGHIAFLQSIGPLYLLARRSRMGAQLELPQCGPDLTAEARRAADKPLKGRAQQRPCDVGLFSDQAARTDLLDVIGRD